MYYSIFSYIYIFIQLVMREVIGGSSSEDFIGEGILFKWPNLFPDERPCEL